ncbi:MAG: tail fiber domain-containing protein [Cytophagales bacterium]|nr:tail fiber domain-containing protein [Cytophagales bacterium]
MKKSKLFGGTFAAALLLAQASFAQNYVAGPFSGGSLSSGNSNSFVGYAAGAKTSSGSHNSFFGVSVGAQNVGGSHNSFYGFQTGYWNKYGNHNSFFGTKAGFKTTDGSDNSFFGMNAGHENTTGARNSFFGRGAGYGNGFGKDNSYFGYKAGSADNNGVQNSFFGSEAGKSNATSYNTFIGFKAGWLTNQGSSNTFVGNTSGLYNTSGAGNVLVGSGAGFYNTAGHRNAFLGSGAGTNNTTGSDNVFVGQLAGELNKTGSGNTALGKHAGPAGENLTNATAIGFRATVTVSNAIVLGSINGKNGATANTKVGIGTTAPTHQLQLSSDDAAKPGTSTWKVASDKRLKKDVTEFKDGMEVLRQVNPVWFKYTGEAGMPTGKSFVGVVAQDMQQVAPYTVETFTHLDAGGKKTDYLNYDAGALTYILVNAVKEQQRAIDTKDERIKALEKGLSDLEKRLAALESGSAKAGRLDQTGSVAGSPEQNLLRQNEPNPFGESTTIRYFVPVAVRTAELVVTDLNGLEVLRRNLPTRGAGSLTFEAASHPAGTYLYQLVLDGRAAGAKKMVILK